MKSTVLRFWLLLLLLAIPAQGGLLGQSQAGERPLDSLANRAAANPAGSTTLHPGDALRVEIWREPDLGGEFLIDEEGVVTLPLLGRLTVTGIPLSELRPLLFSAYEEQLRNPSVRITPLRRIHILGQVHRPGPMAVDPTVTLAGAVALAGGANWEGDLRRFRIVRDGVILMDNPDPGMDLASIDIRSGDQIFVERRSWFARNSAFLVSATLGVAGLIVSIIR